MLAVAELVSSRAEAASAAYRNAVAQFQRASEALEKRRAVFAAAEAAMASWCGEWDEALAGTWLSRQVERPQPQEIGPVLAVLQDLDKLMQKKAELDHRVAGMRRDQAAFTESVVGLAAVLGERQAGDVLTLFSAVRDRVGAALQKEERRLALQGNIERMEESLDSLRAEERLHAANRQRVLDFFDCGTLDEAAACLEAAREEQRLRQRCSEMESDLAARLGVATAAEAEALLAELDDRELGLELARLEEAIDAADRDVSELHADVRTRERALAAVEGGDRVAELEQRRRTLLLDIESKAIGYLRLRAGVIAAEQALRLFRERHRSAMMQRASRTFIYQRRRVFRSLDASRQGPGIPHRQYRRRRIEARPRSFQGHALPALSRAQDRRLPRGRGDAGDAALHRRRHHGNLRRRPRRPRLRADGGNGRCGAGDLSDPP